MHTCSCQNTERKRAHYIGVIVNYSGFVSGQSSQLLSLADPYTIQDSTCKKLSGYFLLFRIGRGTDFRGTLTAYLYLEGNPPNSTPSIGQIYKDE